MQRSQVVIAFLLGAVVALSAALAVTANLIPTASAQAGAGGGFRTPVSMEDSRMIGFSDQTNMNNTVFVLDPKSNRLAVYKFSGDKLKWAGVRMITYDLKVQDYAGGNENFSVSAAQKAAQDAEQPGKK